MMIMVISIFMKKRAILGHNDDHRKHSDQDYELWSFGGFGFTCPENISTPLWNRETYYLPLDLNENFN